MSLKIFIRWSLLIAGVTGIISFLSFDASVRGSYQFSASIQDALPAYQLDISIPIHLKIPNINVDADIRGVGVTSEGAMDAPKGPTETAWFNLGPRPGDKGSAVIAGHYGRWKTGGGSVFDDLSKLTKGDKMYVEDDNGTIITFVVRETRTYGKDEFAPEVFISKDEGSHLNLVTCEGDWSKGAKTYSNRLVVFTDRVE